MADFYALDTHRYGEHSTFYIAPRPPELPADYPIPADVRALTHAAEAAWVDLDLALAEWTDVHDALGRHPRSTETDAEADAWDALAQQAATTNSCATAAVEAFDAWLRANRTTAGAYEVARLDALTKADRALTLAQVAHDNATAAVGRTYGVVTTWLESRYAHDDRPRAIIPGEVNHNARVRAYWENVAAALPEDTPLPGDVVSPGFGASRRT